jgi:hypothetical protein
MLRELMKSLVHRFEDTVDGNMDRLEILLLPTDDYATIKLITSELSDGVSMSLTLRLLGDPRMEMKGNTRQMAL